jgi:farnesyl diphosphate synthase/geranylgeranyl diphosphate synthase type II
VCDAATHDSGSVLQAALAHLDRSPGKRLRSGLLSETARAVGGDAAVENAAQCARAIELIHTYSLVHDDLPAMDDDALRRGQPTLHVAFDEATAILVGDGLQSRAFELIATDERLSAEQRVALVACLAKAAGFEGMVGGQSLDMQATDRDLTLDELKAMHAMKTGALITAALQMGGIIGGASERQQAALRDVGDRIGLAFQIIDDVLDVRSDSATLGKTSGKDAATNKSTYVAHLGLDAAEAEADRLYEEAMALIAGWDPRADALRGLLAKMVKRDR